MIEVKPTRNIELIRSIVTNPILFDLEGGRGLDPVLYSPYLGNLWLSIKKDSEIIGLCEFRKFTTITYESHIYILPEYHGTGIPLECSKYLLDYLRDNTGIRNIITTVPESCVHVTNFLDKIGFKQCGYIINGIIYNDKEENLIVSQLEV